MSTDKSKGKASEDFLIQVPLPIATETYTVISHGEIIQKLENELNIAGLVIEHRDYTYSYNGEIALGKLHITDDRDPDLGIAFTWINSYNKQIKFGCGIGGLILENRSVMLGTKGTSWIRKHTGTANEEAYDILEQLVERIDELFSHLITEKERMKQQEVSDEEFGRIMGALFFEHDLITPNQANAVRKEWMKPEVEYTDKNTLWGLYKILMFGIENGDIKQWHKSQQKLHHMILTEYALIKEGLVTNNIVPGKDALGMVEEIMDEKLVEEYVEETPAEVVNMDTTAFQNVALQLGFKEEDVNAFIAKGFNPSIANSANLKIFREAIEKGISAPKVPVIKMDEHEVANGGKPNGIFTEEAPLDEHAKIAQRIKDNDPETYDESQKDIEEAPIEIAKGLAPVSKLNAFKTWTETEGYAKELVSFYIDDHFDEEDSLEESCASFKAWAPAPKKEEVSKSEPVPTEEIFDEEAERMTNSVTSAIIESDAAPTETEEVVEDETTMEVPLEEATPIEDEVDGPELFDPTMDEMLEASSTPYEGEAIMNSMFDEEEDDSSDNQELAKLLTPVANLTEPVKIIPPTKTEPVVETVEVVEESIEEETPVIQTEDIVAEASQESTEEVDENPFAIDETEEEEEDILEIHDGLEAPDELIQQAQAIETRMKKLYGNVYPYTFEEKGDFINVILDDTLERFAVRV